MSLRDWFSGRVFELVHGHNLVYNTCWEDPRLDRVALDLKPDDDVLVITSAGCNVLDYVLAEPRRVYAVDLNPRQNALLELKLAGIAHLEFEDFFAMFGRGCLPTARDVYQDKLRRSLSAWSRRYWDKWITFFENPRRSFYFRGSSGTLARCVKFYIDRLLHARPQVEALLEAKTVAEQRAIYDSQLRERFWSRPMRFAMNRDATLSMVGVPKSQRRQIETQYEGGLVRFVQDCLDAVFTQLPLADNYFWRVYITGAYSRDCCPEYLRPDNFQRLKAGLVHRVTISTDSVQGFLEKHDGQISRYVLLDHMDWLADRYLPWLQAEWQAIVARASATARVIWRSGGLRTDYLDRVQVTHHGQTRQVPELLHLHHDLARSLHVRDRVHTYGSFYVADLCV